jgi:hypothetical protein
MKVAPNLTRIDYQVFGADLIEQKALSIMKSLIHLKLSIRSSLYQRGLLPIPVLLPLVSHVLKDLIIRDSFKDGAAMPFESFRGLTQLTSLTFQADNPLIDDKVIWFDSFTSIGLPLLPFITFTGPLTDLKDWRSLIVNLPNCGHRRMYFPSSKIAELWKNWFSIEQSCTRIVGNGIYPCDCSPEPIIDHDDCDPTSRLTDDQRL